ncbi:cell division protein FtsK [Fructilactobacillus lindneri]|uniref:DNA translocase FtsK n=3 Tax=Fructilactobacillus lindneri TaxID=53444 RepID=A0A0R2JSJ9_9LACO|nr:cell division protein FtsK [Fructilactobacillus lindneri]KRN78373.1 DNA translocase FtsK [Fructilactobacillus lindneri DSM 20690 = JCM 11027]ANZ59270.1 cell division protein FtsK [Fructilactobacillus lindneri]POG98893.1 cell division protein FtsK [Fructilactobacillus lindneri]POH00150.1 cell division protein FtsK [Fructilactobacillus lindneri]
MTTRKTTRKKITKKRPTKRKKNVKNTFSKRFLQFCLERKINILGLLVMIISLLGFFSLGIIGTFFANLFRILVGNSYQVLLALFGIWGIFLLIEHPLPKVKDRFLVGTGVSFTGYLIFASLSMFNALDQHFQYWGTTWKTLMNDFVKGSTTANVGGGMIGAGLLTIFSKLISLIGTDILAILLMLGGLLIFFNVPVIKITRNGFNWIKKWFGTVKAAHNRRILQRKSIKKPTIIESEIVKHKGSLQQDEIEQPSETIEQSKDVKVNEKPNIRMAINNQTTDEQIFNTSPVKTSNGDYQLPSINLLAKIPPTDQTTEYHAIDKNTQILQKTLKSFGVDAEVKNVSLGPSVTEYELHPAIGVKVSKIVNLSDDLALALAAKDIRIEAPIPGKSLIGIEVPNKEVSMVSFRDVFETQSKKTRDDVLSVPLGKDVNGNVISCDLTKMPHLLIAGSTGSGKSVAINGILTSILLKATPDQVKMMLIDPKKVELGVYNGIPHLLSPVVSEPKKATRALGKVVAEMEKRYELFAKAGQRKISTYNEFIKHKNSEEGTDLPTLPYIVVVVDELADLMMTVSNEVESAIIRLAQMGRAAGVHMILATQRPSVDVITGLIKANVPSRIAFAVSSGTDSRTILDANGAEKLLGRGDMLYEPIDLNKPLRIQGSFISDQDVESVVDFVKQEGDPDYDENMIISDEEITQDEKDEEKDELFDEALDFVVKEHKASTSMLQRRFRIGYNRAARIIDDMEQRGYVGPQRGSTPRTVYKQEDSSVDS